VADARAATPALAAPTGTHGRVARGSCRFRFLHGVNAGIPPSPFNTRRFTPRRALSEDAARITLAQTVAAVCGLLSATFALSAAGQTLVIVGTRPYIFIPLAAVIRWLIFVPAVDAVVEYGTRCEAGDALLPLNAPAQDGRLGELAGAAGTTAGQVTSRTGIAPTVSAKEVLVGAASRKSAALAACGGGNRLRCMRTVAPGRPL
jgi:hypothetical protein